MVKTKNFRVRDIQVKNNIEDGICRLQEDGKDCQERKYQRGMCRPHWAYCQLSGLLDKYGSVVRPPRRTKITLKSPPPSTSCRIIADDRRCMKKPIIRGLCKKHHGLIHHRDDLDIEEFASPIPLPLWERIKKKKRPPKGICIIIEDDISCSEKIQNRGLCERHYDNLRRSPGGIEEWGLAKIEKTKYLKKIAPSPEVCRIIEKRGNDQKPVHCQAKATLRGLCRRHHGIVLNHGKLEEYALPKKKRSKRVIEKKSAGDIKLGECVIIENGTHCHNAADQRDGMVCTKHRRHIWARKDLTSREFMYSGEEHCTVRVAPKGVCCVVENGLQCDREEYAKGICQRHYILFDSRGVLKEFRKTLPDKDRKSPELRVYLDKNIIIDYLTERVFSKVSNPASIKLVEEILAGKIDGTISVNCITACTNFIRLRMSRPLEQGGLAVSDEDARAEAERVVRELFITNNLWRFVSYDAAIMRQGINQEYSWEDGMEWAAFNTAKERKVAPQYFVTRDRHFKDGISPDEILALKLGKL